MTTPAETARTMAIDDTLLVAFADGELDSTTARLVEEQIAADPALARRVAMFRQTADLLHAALSTPDQMEVPPALAAGVARILARPEAKVVRPFFGRRTWLPLAAAAAIAGFIAGNADIGRYWPFGGDGAHALVAHVLNEVADYHGIYASEQEHLVEVPASRKAHLEAWLGDRLKFAFKVPDLSARDLEFQGGRLLAVDRQPVAQLMYRGKDGVVVALCIALTEADASSPLQRRDEAGLALYGSGIGHHVFVVAGSPANPSLRALAEALPALLKGS